MQDHRLASSEHFAAGGSEQDAVPDLPGGTGNCDTNRWFEHEGLSGIDQSKNRGNVAVPGTRS
ncbi:MAG: hypothetical protein A3H91_12150 [Gammaproteobacteria bacterium RIFCSPLOWO2_02_FULL_61_13]|nr:MAG: hypothetical protein A3H91_12150 [Gammaproteobacteria bacterium RIFCSPLOWO2_02_FULL_61_13]